jgi:peptide deformylase
MRFGSLSTCDDRSSILAHLPRSFALATIDGECTSIRRASFEVPTPLLRIVTYPHPALRFESVPVQRLDDALRSHVRAMFDLMYEARGIGLAANQVALPFRFFVLNLTADPNHKDQERVFINPEILKRHSSAIEEEGCLSLPGLFAKIPRAKRVRVRAFDLQGTEQVIDAEDLFSRAVQHETDHVDGRLFTDYLMNADLESVQPQLREFESRFRQSQRAGETPSDEELIAGLKSLINGEVLASR